jgi:mannosylglucosylglycerate synthase
MAQNIQRKKTSTLNIGIVSTRLEGTDGVSLEADKWIAVLERLGHECFFFTGQMEKQRTRSMIVPEAHFQHPGVERIYVAAFSEATRRPEITEQIFKIKEHLKQSLYEFVRQFEIELLLVENALAIPLNIPLGLALTEFIAETGYPTLAHHHDFFWERKRFLVNCVWDYLNMAFPPHLPTIHHIVINSSAANQLSLRSGISSTLIPNIMDFDRALSPSDDYADDLRLELGILPDEKMFLQPTRIVQRKGIEHAIEFTRRLGIKARLIISHASGDEGYGYEEHLREYARLLSVNVNFVSDIIRPSREITPDNQKIYSLGDVYQQADLVTYPSDLEGFGNAFLEAIYYRKPLLVNNYSIFSIDIKPKGFRVIEFDGYISDDTLHQAHQVLQDSGFAEEMAEHNFQLARKHYSYSMLERRMQTLFADFFGEEL